MVRGSAMSCGKNDRLPVGVGGTASIDVRSSCSGGPKITR